MEGINDDHYFRIADFIVMISFRQSLRNNMRLLPSFMPFCTQPSDKCFIHLTVDDELKTATKEEREHHIGNFDTGNGHTSVIQLKNGGYQYIIKDINERDCCLLKTNKDFSDCVCALNGNFNMRCFGLNNALMLVFAFAGSLRKSRIILPANGFFEWSRDEKRAKYRFSVDEAPTIYLCGLYKLVDGVPHFVILTRAANESMAEIHDRMPVIAGEEQVRPYLTEIIATACPMLTREAV